MHVTWKRPDGYHGAQPSDFRILEIGGKSKIWLHKSDSEWFPFQVRGDWKASEDTQRLNQLVNLLGEDESQWIKTLGKIFHNNMTEEAGAFIETQLKWIGELKGVLKGDTWEVEIMDHALSEIEARLGSVKDGFINSN